MGVGARASPKDHPADSGSTHSSKAASGTSSSGSTFPITTSDAATTRPGDFKALNTEQYKAVLVEVSTIGEKGLPVILLLLSCTLEILPGSFTVRQLACLIEIGARQVLGMADAGFGFEAEVQEALRALQASS